MRYLNRHLCLKSTFLVPSNTVTEILENKNGHSFEVDIWSTGVVLYTMLVGRPPYESKDVKSTYKRILANDFTFPDTVTLIEKPRNQPSLNLAPLINAVGFRCR